LTLRTAQGRWDDVVRSVLRDGLPVLSQALAAGRPVALDATTITVAVPSNRAGTLEDPTHGRAIARAFDAVLGLPYALIVRRDAAVKAAQDDRAARWQAAMDHPTVADLLRRFEAEVIEREPMPLEAFRERFARDRDTAARPGGRHG